MINILSFNSAPLPARVGSVSFHLFQTAFTRPSQMKALPFTFKFHPWNTFPSYRNLLNCVKMSDMKSLTKWSFSLPWLHYMADAFVTLLKSSTEASLENSYGNFQHIFNTRDQNSDIDQCKSPVCLLGKKLSAVKQLTLFHQLFNTEGQLITAENQPEWHHKCVEPEYSPPSLVQAEPDFTGCSGKHFRKQMNKFSAGNRNVLHSQSHVLYE